MAAPFPTKWDFVLGTVLIAVNRSDGTWFAVPGPAGPTIALFTTEEAALTAPDDVFDKQVVQVAQVLAMTPEGIGVTVNPGSPGGVAGDSMHVDPATLQALKRLLPPLPAGASMQFKPWVDLPADTGAALLAAVESVPELESVHALVYTIEDSPELGLLAYEAHEGADTAAVDAITSALDTATDLAALGVAGVQVVGWVDLPDDVRRANDELTKVSARG
jgi:hypothetical protein